MSDTSPEEKKHRKNSVRAKAVKGLTFAGRTVIAAAFAQSVPDVRWPVPAHSRQTHWICDCLSGPSSLLGKWALWYVAGISR